MIVIFHHFQFSLLLLLSFEGLLFILQVHDAQSHFIQNKGGSNKTLYNLKCMLKFNNMQGEHKTFLRSI